MKILFDIICSLTAVFASCISFVKFLHFFQLNSYRAETQIKWIKTNPSKIIPNILFGLVSFGFFFAGGIWCKVIYVVLMLLGALFSVPKKAKKPLVYTARIKRLIVTSAIIYAALAVLSVILKKSVLILTILFVLIPFTAIVSNFLNTPIEKAINRHYINDAKKRLSESGVKVIGITGSYGKTSVKYYLSTLLKANYNVLMTPESFNTPMGIVKTIRSSLNSLHEIFVCEMGAKRVGEIKEICDIVHPDTGIITSVGPQHLETFKTLDNVKKTKFELYDAVTEKGGMMFLNGDDENVVSKRGNREGISYSLNGNGDYNASSISLSSKGTTFTFTTPSGESEIFETKLIGRHNVLNITGAAAVAHTLGVSLDKLKIQVRKLESVPHRLELINRGKDIIIDDAYNSNPSGTKAALETLSYFDGFKILLTPGMVELGKKQDMLNFQFGENAAKVCDYCILVGRKQTKSIKEGLESEEFDKKKIYVASDLNDAISHAYALKTNTGKIILLENDLPDNY